MKLSELFPEVPAAPDDDVTLELEWRPEHNKWQVTIAGQNGVNRGGFDFFENIDAAIEYAFDELENTMGLEESYVVALVESVFDSAYEAIAADEKMARYAR